MGRRADRVTEGSCNHGTAVQSPTAHTYRRSRRDDGGGGGCGGGNSSNNNSYSTARHRMWRRSNLCFGAGYELGHAPPPPPPPPPPDSSEGETPRLARLSSRPHRMVGLSRGRAGHVCESVDGVLAALCMPIDPCMRRMGNGKGQRVKGEGRMAARQRRPATPHARPSASGRLAYEICVRAGARADLPARGSILSTRRWINDNTRPQDECFPGSDWSAPEARRSGSTTRSCARPIRCRPGCESKEGGEGLRRTFVRTVLVRTVRTHAATTERHRGRKAAACDDTGVCSHARAPSTGGCDRLASQPKPLRTSLHDHSCVPTYGRTEPYLG